MEDTYSTPEKQEDYDIPPLPHIIKNKNFRKIGEKDEISIVNQELASLKLLLHDALKASHHNKNIRKKYDKKLRYLIIVTLILTNLLSVTITGSVTYFVITQERQGQTGPTYKSGSGFLSGHIGARLESAQRSEESGPGIPTLHIGAKPGLESVKRFEGMKNMEAAGGDSAGDTGITERVHISAIMGRQTNTSTQSPQTYLGSIWN